MKYSMTAIRRYYTTAEFTVEAESYEEAERIFREKIRRREIEFSGLECEEEEEEIY